jgi:lipid II:glycine glycyltransferase (peptidoglycan interpeptide bridge formation enzyme)
MDLETTEAVLQEWVPEEQQRAKWNYIQIRPTRSKGVARTGMAESSEFWLHVLSLEPPTEKLFKSLNKDNLQRRIQRAEREGLLYQRGTSPELLDAFYGLLLKTRRRQALLPQPRKWFENLLKYMSPDAEIRLASKGATPVGAIFTLRHKGTVVYKYGCSDERYHNLGAMPFLFWKMIEESKNEGAEQIDFGRTDLDHAGLIAFKDHFGATRRRLTYLRYPPEAAAASNIPTGLGFARRLFRVLPDFAAAGLGRIAYRHFG